MRIGELAETTGVSTKTLRFYEAEGLLPEPDRTPAGYRDYAAAAAERVTFVRRAQAAGLTLRQIGEVLAVHDDGQAPCRHVEQLVAERLADVEQRLADLRHTHAQLQQLHARVRLLDPDDCPPSRICAAVSDHRESPARAGRGFRQLRR